MKLTPAGDPFQVGSAMVRIRSGPEEGTHTIALSGSLDLESALGVDAELRRLEGEGAEKIVLDLSDLDFIDSTGIAMLLSAARRSEDGGRLEMRRPRSPDVNRLLELTGIGAHLPYR
jgi:anti-anti-sigma factor